MDENKVRELIKDEIAKAIQDGGTIFPSLDAVRTTANEGLKQAKDALTQLAEIKDLDTRLDAEFPFIPYERNCNPQAWALAWKRLFVDQDFMSNLAEQIADPSVAQTMSLWMAHKHDSDITLLKDIVALKNAPKTALKTLCLSSEGGSPEKFRGFMQDKADVTDKTIACIARKCLAFFHAVEKRYTSLLSNKKTSQSKITSQRDEMMLLIFHGIKFMKRKARKAAARSELDAALLEKEFSLEFLFGLAKCTLSPTASPTASPPEESSSSRGTKRPADEANSGKGTKSARKGDPKGSSDKHTRVKELEAQLQSVMEKNKSSTKNRQEIGKWINEQFDKGIETRTAISKILKDYCRNCIDSGRGLHKHSIAECASMGNLPAKPCPLCLAKGKTYFHWKAACPHN